MPPNSVWLMALALAGCGGLLFCFARCRAVFVKIVAGCLTVALAMLCGVWVVNDYYGYYTSWTALADDLGGVTPPAYNSLPADTHAPNSRQGDRAGRVVSFTFAGARSHITRPGLVYLPPQYGQPAFAHVRFPVVELLHGSPGEPSNWTTILQVNKIADQLIDKHLMGPTVFVIPATQSNNHYVDCVNTPREKDETYLLQDVRRDVLAKLRVSREPSQWGIAGFSSGGYCAANLALRHRGSFGAAAIMDGYFLPAGEPSGAALGHDQAALAANSPLDQALKLRVGVSPMPAIWVSAGTENGKDYDEAKAFVAALRGIVSVPFAVERAGHNFTAWSAVVPTMLAWLWQQLAPSTLRVRFPVAGPARSVYVPPTSRYGPLPTTARPAASPTPSG